MANLSRLNNLYLKIFPTKLITKRNIISSNHHALYIHIFAVSVEYQLSIKVPSAIEVGKIINKIAVKRLEAKYFQ